MAVTLDPWREKGIPLERQFCSWKQRVRAPYDKRDVDAYTRTRVILMNGIENEAWINSHQLARCTDNMEVRSLAAVTRMVEQQQQTTVNWLNPADQSVLETTVAYEQVAIDLTAFLARNEPDPYLRETMNFGLLEDFDHLYRYSELLDYLE
jgi:UDP-3-O-acyl-N-acetylglucosamine deacetylase